tara:strand:- start:10 stop:249 length:240 start_codon:yes stop_codon:yes gene_type:complete
MIREEEAELDGFVRPAHIPNIDQVLLSAYQKNESRMANLEERCRIANPQQVAEVIEVRADHDDVAQANDSKRRKVESTR